MPDIRPISEIQQVAKESIEVLNVQRQLEESLNNQNDSFNRMLGFSKTLKTSIFHRLSREIQLNKEVRNIEKQLQDQRKHTATMTDEAKRAESKLVEEGLAQQLSSYSKELEMLKKINNSALAPMLYFFTKIFELFKTLDKAAATFRQTMGFVRSSAADIRKIAEQTAINFGHVGVNIDTAYSSILELSKEMGSVHVVSKDLVKTTAVLKAQLGVSEEASAGFLKNMASISKSTMESQRDMTFMAGALSNAAGVPLPAIMKDIATKSNTTLTMMSRLPGQVIRAAVELRKMGVDLDRASRSSREILNFTDNINAEMEASVLLGNSINLQRARELAYRRDITGSTKEILRLTKSISFESLDVFQQEAFARATGKSVDELLSLVQAERQWEAARKSSDPTMRARVAAYEKLKASNNTILKDQSRQLEFMVMTRSNQERLAAISQKWNQILAQAGQILLPILDTLLAAVIPMMDLARGFLGIYATLSTIGKTSQTIGMFFGVWFERVAAVSNFFLRLGSIGEKIMSVVKGIGGFFGKIFGVLENILPFASKIFGVFGKWIPVIGWIITAFQFVYNLFQRLHGIGDAFKEGILNGIWFGIKAIGGALYDTLLKPFVDVWNWIKGIFIGGSPSTLGLGIVKGITSVASMIFDALTYPWRTFLAWVLEKVPFMSKYAAALRGGATGAVGRSIETETNTSRIPPENVTPTPTTIPGAKPKPQEVTTTQPTLAEAPDRIFQDILSAINTLNNNLESGKIGIYLDGSLVSTVLARNLEFRGSFGG
jgi:hypothetical protein